MRNFNKQKQYQLYVNNKIFYLYKRYAVFPILIMKCSLSCSFNYLHEFFFAHIYNYQQSHDIALGSTQY